MPECVICGKDCKVMLCGDKKCENARKRQRRALMTEEQWDKERQRHREDRDTMRKAVTKVEARCPRCLKHHMYRFEWGYTGKPLPFKFCEICAKFANENFVPEPAGNYAHRTA